MAEGNQTWKKDRFQKADVQRIKPGVLEIEPDVSNIELNGRLKANGPRDNRPVHYFRKSGSFLTCNRFPACQQSEQRITLRTWTGPGVGIRAVFVKTK
jgi:hypothetical protein